MVERKTKKKTTARKPAKKRKTTRRKPTKRKSAKKKQFQDLRRVFFEKLGIITFFVIILLVLLTLLVSQWQKSRDTNSVEFPIENIDYQTRLAFVEEISPIAQKLQRQYGIYASVSMAQAMLESEFGQSGLASDYYNLFGVKTDASDPDGVDLPTAEYVDNKWIESTERFKVYPNWAASMEAHARLLVHGTTWDADQYAAVKNGTTPEEQARGLQNSGYATDPDYADKLIAMMDEWNLYQYNQPNGEQITEQ